MYAICQNKNCGIRFPYKYKSQKRKYCCKSCQIEAQTIKFDLKEAQRLYRSGLSGREVGEILGVPGYIINSAIRKHGYMEESG